MKNTIQQQENTRRFLREYQLLAALEKAGVPGNQEETFDGTGTEIPAGYRGVVHGFRYQVKPGDIRLFSQTGRLTYAAILPWDDDNWLVVPFSHCENPASSDEAYAAGGETRGLFQQVYQLWNARPVRKLFVMRGWKIGELPAEEMKRLQMLCNAVWTGKELPEELQERTGLPIRSLNDPRIPFRKEERENLQVLDDLEDAFPKHLAELGEKLKKCASAWRSPLMQAAAGQENCSAFLVDENAEPQWAECDDGELWPLEAHQPLPEMTWSVPALPEGCLGCTLVFVDAKDSAVLGYGVVAGENAGNASLLLLYPTAEGPNRQLESPNDVRIVIAYC